MKLVPAHEHPPIEHMCAYDMLLCCIADQDLEQPTPRAAVSLREALRRKHCVRSPPLTKEGRETHAPVRITPKGLEYLIGRGHITRGEAPPTGRSKDTTR